MKKLIYFFSFFICLQLNCTAQNTGTKIAVIKNGKVELTVNASSYLDSWSKDLSKEVGNPIRTSLQNLRITKEDNGDYVLRANNAANDVKSGRLLEVVDNEIFRRDGGKTCTCTGCTTGCNLTMTGSGVCTCTPGCTNEKCTKSETASSAGF